MWLKLYDVALSSGNHVHVVSTTSPPSLFFLNAHVKLVKQTGLVSFGDSLDLFVPHTLQLTEYRM